MESEKSLYLLDYTTFSSKIHSTENIIEMLGMQGITFQVIKGFYGYKDRLYYDCVSIHYNGSADMGVCCEMSGQGCRAFESFGHSDWIELYKDILYHKPDTNITRIDIAFDDHDGLLPLDKMFLDTMKGNFVSKHEYWEAKASSKGTTLNFGLQGSKTMVRIYDKAAERGLTDGTHWVRVELQLRAEHAENFARRLITGGYDTVSREFLGILKNYLRFVKPSKTDQDRDRWPMTRYWKRFIGAAERIRLFERPGTEYNLYDLENFVFKQAGNAISTYIDIKGEAAFMDALKKRGTHQNPKYEQLKAKHKQERA